MRRKLAEIDADIERLRKERADVSNAGPLVLRYEELVGNDARKRELLKNICAHTNEGSILPLLGMLKGFKEAMYHSGSGSVAHSLGQLHNAGLFSEIQVNDVQFLAAVFLNDPHTDMERYNASRQL